MDWLRLAAFAMIMANVLLGTARGGDTPEETLIRLIASEVRNDQVSPDAWPDVSENGIEKLKLHDRGLIRQLRSIQRSSLPFEGRRLYDLFEWQTNCQLEQEDAKLYLTPFWQDYRLLPPEGILGAVGVLWSMPVPTTLKGYRDRIKKLDSTPDYINQLIVLMRRAILMHMLPGRQLASEARTEIAAQLRSEHGFVPNPFARGAASSPAELKLYAPFELAPGLTAEDRLRLQEEARRIIRDRVIPSLYKYYDVLSLEYEPACPESSSLSKWPGGVSTYGVLLHLSTTTDLDAVQVEALGRREVKRIRQQMTELLPELSGARTLDQFLSFVRTNSALYFASGDELLTAYGKAIRQIQRVLPKGVRDVPRLDIHLEGIRGGGAASFIPPTSGYPEGVVKVEVGHPELHPSFEVIPLMLHEALPGHALQCAIARERPPNPDNAVAIFMTRARQSDGFIEGWGVYSEKLGYPLGLYSTPLAKFGALRMELMRAVRVVVDTEINLSGWTQQQARGYAAITTGLPEQLIDLDMIRSLWPGHLPAYIVGERAIEQMRDLVANKLVRKFDLGAFNALLLRWGPLPLDVMRKEIEECLTQPSCTTSLEAR